MTDPIPPQSPSARPASTFSTSPQPVPYSSSPHSLSPLRPPPVGQQNLTDSHDGGAPLTAIAAPPLALAATSISGPPFSPLFTIVNNSSTRSTHHPRVHYIFSDDEPYALDEAMARQHAHAQARARHAISDSTDVSALPPAVMERAIVLDLVPSTDGGGWEVGWASSLSPDWAVLKSRLSRVEEGHHRTPKPRRKRNHDSESGPGAADNSQDGDDEDEDSSEGERALMLEIEGVECDKPSSTTLRPPTASGDDRSGGGSGELRLSSGSNTAAARNREDPAALVDEFKKRMILARKVVHADEERHIAMAREAERIAAVQEAIEQHASMEEDFQAHGQVHYEAGSTS